MPMHERGSTAILVLGTADWDQAIPTNQHFAVRELARGAHVTFVESTGLRQPEFTRRDFARMGRRLAALWRRNEAGGSRVSRQVPDNVTVVKPLVIPYHRGPVRAINKLLMRLLLRSWIRQPGPRLLWTYTPVTHGFESEVPTVYHCVDLLAAQQGISGVVVRSGERRLAEAGAVAAASSEAVEHHLRVAGFARVESWPNVADLAVFSEGARDSSRTPRVVFAGNFTTSKVDFSLLEEVVRQGCELHLAGPISEGGGNASELVSRLERLGAVHHGLLSPAELGRLFRGAAVGLIPYVINDYTRGVNPLKTYEYLASGLSVVSTPVPAVEHDGEDVFVAAADEVAAIVRQLMTATEPQQVRRRMAKASTHGWDARGQVMRQLAEELIR